MKPSIIIGPPPACLLLCGRSPGQVVQDEPVAARQTTVARTGGPPGPARRLSTYTHKHSHTHHTTHAMFFLLLSRRRMRIKRETCQQALGKQLKKRTQYVCLFSLIKFGLSVRIYRMFKRSLLVLPDRMSIFDSSQGVWSSERSMFTEHLVLASFLRIFQTNYMCNISISC